MSQLAGKPVRLQFMRWDEHGWDNYGPPQSSTSGPASTRAARSSPTTTRFGDPPASRNARRRRRSMVGVRPDDGPRARRPTTPGDAVQHPEPARASGSRVPLLNGATSRRRRCARRARRRHFAAEQMIDELAYAGRMDPIASGSRTRARTTHDRPVLVGVAKSSRTGSRRWRPRTSERQRRHRPRHRARRLANPRRRRRRHRGEQEDRQDHREHMYGVQDAGLVDQPGLVENQIVGQPDPWARAAHSREAVRFTKARDEPRLGHLSDHAVQGTPEGHDAIVSNGPTRSPTGLGEPRSLRSRGDRQRVLRRDRRPHPRGADDAGPRARNAKAAGVA